MSGDLRWCEVHERWCRSDTARAGLLDDQQPVATPPPPSKNFALPPFRRFNHNVVITWLMTVPPRSPQPSRHAHTPTASTGPPPSPPCPLPAQVVYGSADSIWSNTVLASYVYELMVKTPTNPDPNPSPKPKPKPKRNPKPSRTCSSATSAGAVFHMRLNVLKHACLLLGPGLGLGVGLGLGLGLGLG